MQWKKREHLKSLREVWSLQRKSINTPKKTKVIAEHRRETNALHSQLKQLPEKSGTPQGKTEWSDPVPKPKVLDAVTKLQAIVCQSNVRKSLFKLLFDGSVFSGVPIRRKQTLVKITEYKKQCKMPAPIFEEKGRG